MLWNAVFLIAGLLTLSSFGGLVGQGGVVLLIIAGALGLASTFVLAPLFLCLEIISEGSRALL
jgi:hypothetical protein